MSYIQSIAKTGTKKALFFQQKWKPLQKIRGKNNRTIKLCPYKTKKAAIL